MELTEDAVSEGDVSADTRTWWERTWWHCSSCQVWAVADRFAPITSLTPRARFGAFLVERIAGHCPQCRKTLLRERVWEG
jgi:hypothetical protein